MMWKGLNMLGKMITGDKPKFLSRDDQKSIRAKINRDKLCDTCLYDYQHQTVDGRMLCNTCYKEEYSNQGEEK